MNQPLPSHAALIIGGTSDTDGLLVILRAYGYSSLWVLCSDSF